MAVEKPAVGTTRAGVVKSVNRGGYVVDVDGCPCFCPASEMHPKVPTPSELARMSRPPGMAFKVMYVRGESPVVSRREAALEERREALRATLGTGERVEGVVRKIVRRGALLDLGGGVDGFLPLDGQLPLPVAKDGLRRGLRVLVLVAGIADDGTVTLSL